MKILLIGHTTPMSGVRGMGGGISRYIYHLGKTLVNLGQDVELLIRNDYKPKEPWIKTIYSPKFTWFLYPLFVGMAIKNKKSDIYHSDFVTTGVPLIKKNKRPAVVTIHGVEPFSYNKRDMRKMDKIRLWWYMRSFKEIEKADAIIVMSEFVKREALNVTNIPEEKIYVTYNGLDFKKFFPIKKEKTEKIKIGYLGGLDGRKNVILLVEAFKKLAKERDDIELHVGGAGRNLKIFRSMKIKNAYFYGKIPEQKINEFYNSLDIFVFPSLSEGFGLPPLEAMACGVPVIACNRSSMPEVIGDAGILAEPSEKEMKSGITRLIEDEYLRKKLGKKSLERAKQFTWEKCAKNTLKVYEEVLKC